MASDLNSVNTITNNFTDINNKELSGHISIPPKKKSKVVSSNHNNIIFLNNYTFNIYFLI